MRAVNKLRNINHKGISNGVNVRSIYFRITKNKKIKIAAMSCAALILALGAWIYLTAGNLATTQARAVFLRDNPWVIKLLPAYWQVRKLSDIIYFKEFFRDDEVSDFSLVIAPDDLQRMNDSLPDGFMNVLYYDKVFVPAKFIDDGRVFDVRVRYRGDNAVHWNAKKRSYLVKFKDNDKFQGMTEFSFIIPDDRNFAIEHFNNIRAGKLGLRVPASGFANLNVNGMGRALYFTMEGWSREMLDKWGLGPDAILYGDADRPELSGSPWNGPEHWELLADDPRLTEAENLAPLHVLLDLHKNASQEEFDQKIFELIDRDNFFAWQAHQELANSSHQGSDNVRLYYDAGKKKLFFIPWDVEIESLALRDNFRQYEGIAARVFQNPGFEQEKNERLRGYVANDQNLADDLKFYEETYESFDTSLHKDRLKIYTNRYADSVYRERRTQIIEIFQNLKGKLAL